VKDMQILNLYSPKDVFKGDNLQCIFNLQQFNNKDQLAYTNIINRNCKPLRIFENNLDQGYDNGFAINIDDISNNDKKILFLLREDLDSVYTFKALERQLDIHQQSLSRALKRLVYMDLVEKTPVGYKLNTKITFSSSSSSKIQSDQLLEDDLEEYPSLKTKKAKRGFHQLIQISIPIKSNIDTIVNRLVGKWFGHLRWLGLIKRETGFILQWAAINKHDENNNNLFQINLVIISEYIVIESNALSDIDKIKAMSNANRIITELIKILQYDIQKEFTTIYENNLAESNDVFSKEIHEYSETK